MKPERGGESKGREQGERESDRGGERETESEKAVQKGRSIMSLLFTESFFFTLKGRHHLLKEAFFMKLLTQ